MSEINTIRVSYSELRNGSFRDKYDAQDEAFVSAAGMSDQLKQAMLECPGNTDGDKTAMFIVVDGRKEVGRCFMFGTKIKTPDSILETQALYGLEAIEEYRNQGVGTLLMMFPLSNKEYDVLLAGDTTSIVTPMYKKLKYIVFEIPQFSKLRNPRYILMPLGMRGWLLSLSSAIVSVPIHLLDMINNLRIKRLKKRFLIKKETIVPQWAGDMATKDGHSYMELHNRDWLQWSLDHTTHIYKEDHQAFYAVYSKENIPQGFFMIKERFVKNAGRIKNYLRGKVVEWATTNDRILSEADLNLLALSVFSSNIDVIETVTTDHETEKNLKKMGFVRRDVVRMAVKDKRGRLNDDLTKWRLRYGMANSVIY